MSTKTSSPLQAINTPTTTTTASSSSSGSSPSTPLSAVASIANAKPSINPHAQTAECTMNAIKIKSELPSDEIKEYAETTMKELLGWYGFDGLDRLDLSTKTARLLQAAAANDNCNSAAGNSRGDHHQPPTQPHHMERRNQRSRGGSRVVGSLMQTHQHRDELIRKASNPMVNNNNISGFSNNNNTNCNANCASSMLKSNFSRNSRSAGGGIGSTDGGATSDHDTRSSREDDSKSPQSTASKTGVVMEEKIDLLNCCWCRRPVPDNAPEFLTTCDGPRYCSESCFAQSRRASFKKAKTCDWCKHVRHAVSYVDFQDGASQLQFCSDKCLNQYKMQIFCKETQAHLDMNPHLRDQAMEAAASGNGACLITPDLWLRNCRSRSASPASTVSVSPGPAAPLVSVAMPRKSPPSSATAATCGTTQSGGHLITSTSYSSAGTPQSSYKPIISVAPASKLMSRSPSIMPSRTSPKHSRKKRQLRSSSNASSSGVNELHNPKASSREMAALTGSSAGSAMQNKCGKSLLHVNTERTNHLRASPGHMIPGGSTAKSPASSLSQFAGSSVQDLHMSVPPLSPMMDTQPSAGHPSGQMPPMTLGGHGASIIPPSYFATAQGSGPTATSMHLPQAAMGHRPPPPPLFLHNPPPGMPPRFMGFPPSTAGLPQVPLPPHFMQHPMMGGDFSGGLASLFGPQPPVTIMVPYPVIVPLPIPIPIPLPIKNFYKAYLSHEERLKFEEEERQKAEAQGTAAEQENRARTPTGEPQEAEVSEEPLDFTKSRDDTKVKSEKDAEPSADRDGDGEKSSSGKPEEVAKMDDVDSESRPVKENAENDYSNEDARGKLPKLKITRLQTKRTLLTQTKESECSRPLRKRKRIIDCDFQKIALKEKTEAAEESGARESSDTYETTGELPSRDDDDDDSVDRNDEPPIQPVCNSNNNNNNIEDDENNGSKIK